MDSVRKLLDTPSYLSTVVNIHRSLLVTRLFSNAE